MRRVEHDALQELFDLSDLKAGLTNVRDASKVVLHSITGIVDAMLLPFRVFFSLSTSSAFKKFENYYNRRQDREREIESELRQLGAYDFNPDHILLNPVIGLAAMPIQAARFFFDEAGVSEVPSWFKKAQDRLADLQKQTTTAIKDQPGLLTKLASLFFIVAAYDPVGDLISEATGLAKAEREALDAFSAVGINLEGMQQDYFSEMIASLTDLRDTVKRRQEIFNKISKIRTPQDLRDVVVMAKNINPEFDAKEIETAIDDFESGENDDPQAINQAMVGIMGEGVDELKQEVTKIISKFPSLDLLKKSSYPAAESVIDLIEEISGLTKNL